MFWTKVSLFVKKILLCIYSKCGLMNIIVCILILYSYTSINGNFKFINLFSEIIFTQSSRFLRRGKLI